MSTETHRWCGACERWHPRSDDWTLANDRSWVCRSCARRLPSERRQLVRDRNAAHDVHDALVREGQRVAVNHGVDSAEFKAATEDVREAARSVRMWTQRLANTLEVSA